MQISCETCELDSVSFPSISDLVLFLFLFHFLVFSVFLIHCLRGGSKRCFFHCMLHVHMWVCGVSARFQLQAHHNIMIVSIVKVIHTHHSPAWNVYSECFWLLNDLNNFKFMQKYHQQQHQAAANVFCLYLFLVFKSLPLFRHSASDFCCCLIFHFSRLLYIYFYFVSVIWRRRKNHRP